MTCFLKFQVAISQQLSPDSEACRVPCVEICKGESSGAQTAHVQRLHRITLLTGIAWHKNILFPNTLATLFQKDEMWNVIWVGFKTWRKQKWWFLTNQTGNPLKNLKEETLWDWELIDVNPLKVQGLKFWLRVLLYSPLFEVLNLKRQSKKPPDQPTIDGNKWVAVFFQKHDEILPIFSIFRTLYNLYVYIMSSNWLKPQPRKSVVLWDKNVSPALKFWVVSVLE